MDEERIPKQAMNWQPDSGIKWQPGRTRNTLLDNIQQGCKRMRQRKRDDRHPSVMTQDELN